MDRTMEADRLLGMRLVASKALPPETLLIVAPGRQPLRMQPGNPAMLTVGQETLDREMERVMRRLHSSNTGATTGANLSPATTIRN